MRQDLAEGVVGEGLGVTVRVLDAQHFAVGFAFQRGGLVQGIGDGDEVMAFVEAVPGVFARAILETFDLSQGVPPQVFGLVCGVDDGVRQAVIAVEVFGLVAQRIDFGDEVALGVVACFPGAAVRVINLRDQGGQVVVLVFDLAPERIGFFDQPSVFVVLELDGIAIGQYEAGHVAGVVNLYNVVFATEVAARGDAVIAVVMKLSFAPEYIGDPRGAGSYVVTEMEVLAIAGPVFHHSRLVCDGFPAVIASQAQGIAVTGHDAVGVTEAANRIVVAIDHLDELAIVVVAILHQGFDSLIVDDAFDIGQAAQRVVVMQVHTNAAGGADVGQRAVDRAGEMQEVAEGIFDAL